MTDKRPQTSHVNGVINVMNLLQHSQYSWNISLLRESIWVLLQLVRSAAQNFTIINQEKHKIKQLIYIWNPMTTRYVMQTLIYTISTEFLWMRCRCSSWQNASLAARRNGCIHRLEFPFFPCLPCSCSLCHHAVNLNRERAWSQAIMQCPWRSMRRIIARQHKGQLTNCISPTFGGYCFENGWVSWPPCSLGFQRPVSFLTKMTQQ